MYLDPSKEKIFPIPSKKIKQKKKIYSNFFPEKSLIVSKV